MSSEPLIKRYTPATVSEVIGQTSALRQIMSFLYNFPREKALFLHGPTGVGKTISVQTIASQMKYELIELNASDKRNKNSIEETLLPASQQASLFGGKKIILVDEIDNLSGMQDRGGAQVIEKIIELTKFPIILVANDAFIDKLKAIRKASTLIEFKPLSPEAIASRLAHICNKEKIEFEEKAIAAIAIAAQGDLRAAINDLEIFGSKVRFEDVKASGREKDESLHTALKAILCSNDIKNAMKVVENINEEYDLLALYLDENLQRVYDNKSLAKAYDCVSKANIFNSRIMRQQHWRFLIYVQSLLVSGVCLAKEGVKNCPEFKQPFLMLKMWQRNMRRAKTKAMLEGLAEEMHTSVSRLEKDFLPYYEFMNQKAEFN